MAAEEQPLKEHKQKQRNTLREKIRIIKDNITIEPVLAFYVVPSVLTKLASQNLSLDKACRVNKNYDDTVCDALVAREGTKYIKEELEIQQLIAQIETWKSVLLTAIPSILILFLGAWSDRTGKRKVCILLPILGELLACVSNMINVYFFYEFPVEVMAFFEAFLPAITGGWVATYMGVFSYISDASSEETRTFRVGVANLCLTAGSPIGSVLSGFMLKHVGYYGVFSLSCLFYSFSIIYGFIYVKDQTNILPEKTEKENSSNLWGFLRSFFDIKHVKDTLSVAFKKGPNHRRTKSILILTMIAFIYGSSYGEGSVKYLFCRYRFNWDALNYSFYNTFYIVVHVFGSFISISLFSRRFNWDDSVLGLISTFSKLIGALGTGFARTTLEMYIAVAVETLNATSFTALRSISSKLVASDELGKMISVFNLIEVMTSMIFGPVYSWIYMFTVKIDAGIFYYVSTMMTVPPIIMFGWFYIQHKRSYDRTKTSKVIEDLEKSFNLDTDKRIDGNT